MDTFWETLTLEDSEEKQREEFAKKYRGCWVHLQKDKHSEKRLVYFSGWSSDKEAYVFEDIYSEMEYNILHETDSVVSVSFPTPKLITHQKKLLYFCRVPARQYRKAPCNDNCASVDVTRKLARVMRPGLASAFRHDIASVTGPMLQEAYAPTYHLLNGAVEELFRDTEALGFAVSEDFGVTIHPESDEKLLLWYGMSVVAEINSALNIVVMVPQFKQEVVDFIKRHNYHYSVL